MSRSPGYGPKENEKKHCKRGKRNEVKEYFKRAGRNTPQLAMARMAPIAVKALQNQKIHWPSGWEKWNKAFMAKTLYGLNGAAVLQKREHPLKSKRIR